MKVRSQDTISIGRSLYQKMLEDVKLRAPEEACGIVAGRNNLPSHVYVIENELHSQVAFRMDPQQQVIAFLEMEKQDLEMLAIYHSHPTGSAFRNGPGGICLPRCVIVDLVYRK